jgi:hypothetical protein
MSDGLKWLPFVICMANEFIFALTFLVPSMRGPKWNDEESYRIIVITALLAIAWRPR